VETRYFRYDDWTVNGLSAYKLCENESSTSAMGEYRGGLTLQVGYWGIRVWTRNTAGEEQEVTEGEPVAVVQRETEEEGLQSADWQANFETQENDAVVVRVYTKVGSGPWGQQNHVLAPNYITEQLPHAKFDSLWTVFYYTYVFKYTYYYYCFGFGSLTYPSRIENFAYTVGVEEEAQVKGGGVVQVKPSFWMMMGPPLALFSFGGLYVAYRVLTKQKDYKKKRWQQ
jgi:hypothetical protein